MNFKSILLHLMFLPDFQSSRSNAFFKSIVQFEIFCSIDEFEPVEGIARVQWVAIESWLGGCNAINSSEGPGTIWYTIAAFVNVLEVLFAIRFLRSMQTTKKSTKIVHERNREARASGLGLEARHILCRCRQAPETSFLRDPRPEGPTHW